MDKQHQFTDWLCGIKGAEFPFFKDFRKVNLPEMPDADADNENAGERDADNAQD